jgi:hypothetical protein
VTHQKNLFETPRETRGFLSRGLNVSCADLPVTPARRFQGWVEKAMASRLNGSPRLFPTLEVIMTAIVNPRLASVSVRTNLSSHRAAEATFASRFLAFLMTALSAFNA